MPGDQNKRDHAERGTTRSPADRDIFGDEGPRVPTKDKRGEAKDDDLESSEAGGVD